MHVIVRALLLPWIVTMNDLKDHVFTKDAAHLHITPPSTYNAYSGPMTMNPRGQTRPPQDKFVLDFLKYRKNGTFVELGGYDGVTFSNTLWLEREHGWSGLLIEANPELCERIKHLQRRSWLYCGCLSSTPQQLNFAKSGSLGGLVAYMDTKHKGYPQSQTQLTAVHCQRPSTIFNECFHQTHPIHIDFFSLDVEGAELQVLESLRTMLESRRLVVEVWSIEYRLWDGTRIVNEKTRQNLQALRSFFNSLGGYNEVGLLSNTGPVRSDEAGLDVIFRRARVGRRRGPMPRGEPQTRRSLPPHPLPL